MDPISLAILAINGLRTVLANPVLGGGSSVKMDQASAMLGVLGSLLEQGDDAIDDLREFTETIEAMASQGRGPTPDEWNILQQRSEDAHARLQAVKEELLGQEEEEETTPEPPAETEEETSGTVEPGDTTGSPV